jgi:hypothetical protein
MKKYAESENRNKKRVDHSEEFFLYPPATVAVKWRDPS